MHTVTRLLFDPFQEAARKARQEADDILGDDDDNW